MSDMRQNKKKGDGVHGEPVRDCLAWGKLLGLLILVVFSAKMPWRPCTGQQPFETASIRSQKKHLLFLKYSALTKASA